MKPNRKEFSRRITIGGFSKKKPCKPNQNDPPPSYSFDGGDGANESKPLKENLLKGFFKNVKMSSISKDFYPKSRQTFFVLKFECKTNRLAYLLKKNQSVVSQIKEILEEFDTTEYDKSYASREYFLYADRQIKDANVDAVVNSETRDRDIKPTSNGHREITLELYKK